MGIIKLLFQKVVKSEDIREFPKMTIKMSSLSENEWEVNTQPKKLMVVFTWLAYIFHP